MSIQRPSQDEYDTFYRAYIDRVPEGDIATILRSEGRRSERLFRSITDAQSVHRYAPGKWSAKEVIGHLADTERIMACRLLRISRGDATPLPGFEENDYVAAADFDRRPLTDLVDEWSILRASTLALLRWIDEEDSRRMGMANDHPVSARAVAYIIAGHELHHRAVLRERYGIGT